MLETLIKEINQEIAKNDYEEISTLKKLNLSKTSDLNIYSKLLLHYLNSYIYPASHLLAVQNFTQARHYDINAFLEPVPSGLTLTLLKKDGVVLEYESKSFEKRLAYYELTYAKEKKRANLFLVLRAESVCNVVDEMLHFYRDFKDKACMPDITESIKETSLPSWLYKELLLDFS